jgi:hypothetical protein
MSDPTSKEDKRLAYLARLRGQPAPAEPLCAPKDNLATSLPPKANPGRAMDKTDIQAMTSGSAGERIPGFSARIGTNTVKRIGEVVDEHPDKALAIFRSWMTQ